MNDVFQEARALESNAPADATYLRYRPSARRALELRRIKTRLQAVQYQLSIAPWQPAAGGDYPKAVTFLLDELESLASEIGKL